MAYCEHKASTRDANVELTGEVGEKNVAGTTTFQKRRITLKN